MNLHRPLRNANDVYRALLNDSERFAIWLTDRVGTIGFFLIIFAWTVAWLAWNMWGPAQLRFDPYPAFVLWLFISNMIQIFLMPLIMVGQNLQGRHAEVRAENDYQVNMRAEAEIREIKEELAQIKRLLQERDDDDD